jgi:hypothetical protein
MSFATRVLDGLGPAFRAAAGDLLPGLVDALSAGIDRADQLIQPADPDAPSWILWWPAAFDLDHTPDPAWLGNTTGTEIPGGLTATQTRDLIRDHGSWRRGTPAALLAAVQATLIGTRQVEITERNGSPWQLRVLVYAAETPDPDATLAAILSQKPVGIVLDFVVAAGATFQHFIDVHGPTFDDDQAAFPLFVDASTHIPEP